MIGVQVAVTIGVGAMHTAQIGELRTEIREIDAKLDDSLDEVHDLAVDIGRVEGKVEVLTSQGSDEEL